MELIFRLYMLIDKDSELGYPYVAMSDDTKHVLFIDEDCIAFEDYAEDCVDVDDKALVAESYVLTSRYFTFDFYHFHSLVKEFTNNGFYEFSANFTGRKNYRFRYTSKKKDKFDKNERVYIGRPKKAARQMIKHFPKMEEIWEQTFENL